MSTGMVARGKYSIIKNQGVSCLCSLVNISW